VGQVIEVFWRGQPLFISHRTPKEIEAAQNADWRSLRDPQPNSERIKAGHEQWLVVSAICTHLGCIPTEHQGNCDSWFCQRHGSQYDSSGRTRAGPAPPNLALVPYEFLSDTMFASALADPVARARVSSSGLRHDTAARFRAACPPGGARLD